MDLSRTVFFFILKSPKMVEGYLLKPINVIQQENKLLQQNWIKIKNIQIQVLVTFLSLHTNFQGVSDLNSTTLF